MALAPRRRVYPNAGLVMRQRARMGNQLRCTQGHGRTMAVKA